MLSEVDTTGQPLFDNQINPIRLKIGLYTLEDVAAALGKSPSTIKDWVAKRVIPSVKVGNKLHVREADLKRWVDSLEGMKEWELRSGRES